MRNSGMSAEQHFRAGEMALAAAETEGQYASTRTAMAQVAAAHFAAAGVLVAKLSAERGSNVTMVMLREARW